MAEDDSLVREMGERVARLGYELVELERAGSRSRPILRLRIDRSGSEPGAGISVEECARVSRDIEAALDDDPRVSERYVLEVSSPGVERPLVRHSDFERFAGQEVALLGRAILAGRSRRLEGELLGIAGEAPDERIAIRLGNGEEVEVPRSEVERAHLVFRWP
jgi:ribosome maturation factor RimP